MVEAMTENIMYICGLSMEMELAEEMGTIGKCIDCIHHQVITDDIVDCEMHGRVPVRDDCQDWVVDYR